MGATFIGASSNISAAGTNTLTVPVGTQAGDLLFVHALGQNANMAIPAGFNVLQLASGPANNTFTTAAVSWKICPASVPATIDAGSSGSASMACMAVYRADPGETFFIGGTAAANGASGQNITPGNIVTSRAATVLMCPASNSANNAEIVTFGGSYTARSNTTTTNRIATSIFETTVGAGTTALPTVTLNRTEHRGFFAVAFYTASVLGNWTYATATHSNNEGVAAAVDDKIYLVGGSIGQTSTRMYDPDLDTITSKATVWSSTTSTSSACSYGGYVWHFKSASFSYYDPVANAWFAAPTPPYTVTSSWIVPDGLGNLWAAGGDGTGSDIPLMKYDTVTQAWSTSAMTVNNNTGKRAVLGGDGMIYSFGGSYNGVLSTAVQKIDPVAETVTTSTVLPGARTLGQVGSNSQWVFYTGGWTSAFVVDWNHWAFDTETATWTTKSPALVGVNAAQYASIDRRFYIIGGIDEGDNTVSAIQVWHDPEVNGGVLTGTGVALSSLAAEGYGDITGVAITVGDAEVVFTQSVQADSFLDMGSTTPL